MNPKLLQYLWCPECHGALAILEQPSAEQRLNCTSCAAEYPIRNGIPRFVSASPYADSFGHQWRTFARSQIDSRLQRESEARFDSEVGWRDADLCGKVITEVGSGAGRFVDVVKRRGASLVIGLDITDAVDAAQETFAGDENVCFVQGDIFRSPLRAESMDFSFSIGVLHHTPEPETAFQHMVDLVKASGQVAVSLYENSLYERPNRTGIRVTFMEFLWSLNMLRSEIWRGMISKLPPGLFLGYCKHIVPVLHAVNKVPLLRYMRYFFPATCYRHLPVEFSMVDTHDTYATRIVHQYRGRDVFQWFLHLGLRDIILRNSRAGWVSLVAKVGSCDERLALTKNLQRLGPPGVTHSPAAKAR